MKVKDLSPLICTVLAGMLLVIPLQQYLLASPDLIASLGIREPETFWVQNVLPPLTYGIWIGGVLVTLIWIIQASQSTFSSSKSALSRRVGWFLYAGCLYLAYLVLFLVLANAGSVSVAMEIQLMVLLAVMPIDILVLFWLPTAMATPGTLRYVPPLAAKVRKLIGA